MTRQILISQIIKTLDLLPQDKIRELSDFADFLLSKIEERDIMDGIRTINAEDETFDFLNDERDLYSLDDLEEIYDE